MKKEGRQIFAGLLLLTVFAVGLLAALLGGAGVYRRIHLRDQQTYQRRTVGVYLTTRVRQAEQVTVADGAGTPTLCLPQQIGERRYVTWIYCHDGWLMELFALEGAFDPEAGEKLLPLDWMRPCLEDGFLALEFSEQGQTRKLYLEVIP